MGLSQKTAQSIPKILVFWDVPNVFPNESQNNAFGTFPKMHLFLGHPKILRNSPITLPKVLPKGSQKLPVKLP
eukprot:jgi/Botrbrau1/4041/Bobra.152_3s0002.1